VHRCRIIPLVSKAFRRVHNKYPPQRETLELTRPITRATVIWFRKIASSLKSLEVHQILGGQGCLSQMLTFAAITAPNLEKLKIDWIKDRSGALLSSISFLSQLKKLTINDLEFPEKGGLTDLQSLSGLQSLEVNTEHLNYPLIT